MSSADLELLRHLAGLTGVSVTIMRRNYDRLGCGEHCPERHQHVHSVTGRWQLIGARARVVLVACRPYLVRLADEADHVLQETDGATYRPTTVQRMADLGWAV